MNNEIIKDFWRGSLHKFSYEEIRSFSFNIDTEKYLTQIGIPILEISEDNRFSYRDSLEYLETGNDKFAVFAEDLFKCFRLGINLYSYEIFLLASETVKKTDYVHYYVNKDIQTYFYCFTLMKTKMKKYPLLYCDYDNIEADKQQFAFVQEMYYSIKTIDNKAVMRGSHWMQSLFNFAINELGNHLDEITALVNIGKYKSEEEAMYAFMAGKEKFND